MIATSTSSYAHERMTERSTHHGFRSKLPDRLDCRRRLLLEGRPVDLPRENKSVFRSIPSPTETGQRS